MSMVYEHEHGCTCGTLLSMMNMTMMSSSRMPDDMTCMLNIQTH